MLVAADPLERLKLAGVSNLTPVPAKIKWRSKRSPEYFELEILPTLRLSPSYMDRLGKSSPCQKCGILRGVRESDLPDRPARLAHCELDYSPELHAPSLPKEWDLLRIQDREGTIGERERVREAARKTGRTKIRSREAKDAEA